MNTQTRAGRASALVAALAAVLLPTAIGGAPRPPAPPATEPPIGWCAFYPYVDVGSDAMAVSGASMLSVCAGGWGMGQVEGAYDFSPLEKQIAYAEKHGLKLALINEINPVYTPEWLRKKVAAAGQTVVGPSGTPGPIPSISSGIFAAAQEELVRRSVEFVKQRDTRRVVGWYHPGAEWWFPVGERYNPRDIARFRTWLAAKYGKVERLNNAWGMRCSRFEEAPAPRIDMAAPGWGHPGLAVVLGLDGGSEHCSWSTPGATDPNAKPGPETYAAVTPGATYTASAWVRSKDLRGYGSLLEIAWVGPKGGAPVTLNQGQPIRGSGDWRRISVTAKAPAGAGRAWLLLKVIGSGTATFDDVELHQAGGGPNLAPNPGLEGAGGARGWAFQDWPGSGRPASAFRASGGHSGPGCLEISAQPLPPAQRPFRNASAAVNDWSDFWQEAAADYINSLSRLTKRLDPTRPTVTYLTMAWAFPSEWDESQRHGIAPDEVAMRGKSIDAFGMQLCSADGDPFRATACLDLVRKYGKPMWTVDLVDFTSGVKIGYPAMDRITQGVIQHGAAGIIYCAWHIPTVLDYSFHPNMPQPQIQSMLTDARSSARLLHGMRPVADGALVLPILPATPDDEGGVRNDYRSFAGWYKAFERMGLTVDLVTFKEMAAHPERLARYRWIMAPDSAFLPRRALAALKGYVRGGGKLVTGGRFAQRDDAGRAYTAAEAALRRTSLPDLGRRAAGDPVRDTHAGNTPPLFLWRPIVGEAARIADQAVAALTAALPRSQQAVRLSGRSRDTRVVRWSGGGRQALYLVPMGAAVRTAAGAKATFAGCRTADALVDGARRALPCRRVAGALEVTLPAYRSSCIVIAK
jgi:hypothetical protein